MNAASAPQETASKRPGRWLRFSLRTLMIVVTVVCIGIAGKLKYDWYRKKWLLAQWVAPLAEPSKNAKRDAYGDPIIPSQPAGLSADEAAALLKIGILELDTSPERYAALAILIDSRPGEAVPILRRIVGQCRHPDEQAMLLHVISLLRDPEDIPRIEPYLKSKWPQVRAAAAESLGYIHEPSYGVAQGFQLWGSRARLNTTPAVYVSSLIGTGRPFVDDTAFEALDKARRERIPATLRERLEGVMLTGETVEERTAAARALVAWPPSKYQLRLAEWGVWIDEGEQLRLAKSVLEENPPFVHGTGNPVATLERNRYEGVIVITKPIIHLTADRPLAVDLEVSISHGRPWYAFPRPDQITVHGGGIFPPPMNLPDAELAPLDPPQLPGLAAMSEGYPWIHPDDRSSGASLAGYSPNYDISSIGLRWQSLIVSPTREPWMTPPQVPDVKRFDWWRSLRDVPSSWVVSQGETERFVYYDGPTLACSPHLVHLTETGLSVSSRDMFRKANDRLGDTFNRASAIGKTYAQRDCILIECSAGVARTFVFRVSSAPDAVETLELKEQEWLSGDQVDMCLRRVLLDSGLSDAEVGGLLSAWRERFFENPGRRLLTVLTAQDYDRLCPLAIRPRATEMARVGLILTEL
jgi:hypothetical protein